MVAIWTCQALVRQPLALPTFAKCGAQVSRGAGHNGQSKERDARIFKLKGQGLDTRALAERFRLSATYITTILKRERKLRES